MKTYTAVIKGNTDKDVLQEILGDEFELESLKETESSVSKESALEEIKSHFIGYLYEFHDEYEGEYPEFLNEFLDTIHKAVDERYSKKQETPVNSPGPACPQCGGELKTKITHEGKEYCSMDCIHKTITA